MILYSCLFFNFLFAIRLVWRRQDVLSSLLFRVDGRSSFLQAETRSAMLHWLNQLQVRERESVCVCVRASSDVFIKLKSFFVCCGCAGEAQSKQSSESGDVQLRSTGQSFN